MKLRARPEQRAELDISPLIDMVFILLIFFMVSTTFVKDMKLDIERPGAATAQAASSKALRVNIDAGSNIYIDGNPVRPWMVQSRVREFLESSGGGSVLVITDRRVPADRLIEVVDQCRLAGATDVGVATEKEAG
ncbi:MAG: biopolymer transporter ExbD [Kofleriaceae bacterium]|nr:biopolymer transporter ExbD [Kofleriaceae bacterium]MCL4223175.1 biopolymer transporter ExbD [Myxococcales bacterium]